LFGTSGGAAVKYPAEFAELKNPCVRSAASRRQRSTRSLSGFLAGATCAACFSNVFRATCAPSLRQNFHALQQLELFERPTLTPDDFAAIVGAMRQQYWFVRNARSWRYADARRRKAYREIARQKKRLLEAGVTKSEILELLQCLRLRCKKGKECPHCSTYRFS
jgi:hypothetical protein